MRLLHSLNLGVRPGIGRLKKSDGVYTRPRRSLEVCFDVNPLNSDLVLVFEFGMCFGRRLSIEQATVLIVACCWLALPLRSFLSRTLLLGLLLDPIIELDKSGMKPSIIHPLLKDYQCFFHLAILGLAEILLFLGHGDARAVEITDSLGHGLLIDSRLLNKSYALPRELLFGAITGEAALINSCNADDKVLREGFAGLLDGERPILAKVGYGNVRAVVLLLCRLGGSRPSMVLLPNWLRRLGVVQLAPGVE